MRICGSCAVRVGRTAAYEGQAPTGAGREAIRSPKGNFVAPAHGFMAMGNLQEWTANTADTLRGGWFMDTSLDGPGCLYAKTAHSTTYWDDSIGFRCCADAH